MHYCPDCCRACCYGADKDHDDGSMITNIWHVMPGYVLASPIHVVSQQASQASLRHPVMGNVTADASSGYVVYQSELHPTPYNCLWAVCGMTASLTGTNCSTGQRQITLAPR